MISSRRLRWLGVGLLTVLLVAAGGGAPALARGRADGAALLPVFGPGSPVPDVPVFPPIQLNDRLRACLPVRLHPISRKFLDAWLRGSIGTRTFRRFFHMPNSDYLSVSECLVRVRTRLLEEARRFSPI